MTTVEQEKRYRQAMYLADVLFDSLLNGDPAPSNETTAMVQELAAVVAYAREVREGIPCD